MKKIAYFLLVLALSSSAAKAQWRVGSPPWYAQADDAKKAEANRNARYVDASACYAVSNADARQYCLARARGESSQCYAIQAADMRALCLAEVRK